jgi:hypothetical protein
VVVEVVLRVLVDKLLLVVPVVVHNPEDGHLVLMVVLVVAAEVSLSMDHLTVVVVEDLVITTQAILVLVDLVKADS